MCFDYIRNKILGFIKKSSGIQKRKKENDIEIREFLKYDGVYTKRYFRVFILDNTVQSVSHRIVLLMNQNRQQLGSFLIIKTNSHNLFIIIICERCG